jgi:hypothetical protein
MTLKLEEGITVEDMELGKVLAAWGDGGRDLSLRIWILGRSTLPLAYSSILLDEEVVSMDNNAHYYNETPEEIFLVRHFSEERRIHFRASKSSYACT